MGNNEYQVSQLLEKHSKQLMEDLISLNNENIKQQETDKSKEPVQTPKHHVYGIAGIAQLFGCSIPTAQRIKSSGVIDEAISQCGKIIVVDADLALDLLRLSNNKWGYKGKNRKS